MSPDTDTSGATARAAVGDAVGDAASNPATPPHVARRYPPTPLVGVAVAVFRRLGTPDIPATSGTTDVSPLQHLDRLSPPASGGAQVGEPQGEVLLVQRKYPPRAGEWGLPGGRLRLGEQLAAGVQRELWEECAIHAHLGEIFDAFEPIVHDSKGRIEYHYVVIEYWADYHSGIARAADDAAALAWIPMDTLESYNLQADSQELIRRAYRAWQDWTAHGKND